MIKLRAPIPSPQTMMVMPNPEFGDSEAIQDKVQIRRAMDGTMYSYVTSAEGNRELDMEFNLTRLKALELEAFARSYHASKIELTDHLDQVWIGTIKTDVIELTTKARNPTKPGGELVTVRFQFQGILQ